MTAKVKNLPDIFSKVFNSDYNNITCLENFFKPAKVYKTDKIIVTKDYHNYDSLVFVERLNMYAAKDELRNLGLLILSMLFSRTKEIQIHLTNEKTELEIFKINPEIDFYSSDLMNCSIVPLNYKYSHTEYSEYPFYDMQQKAKYREPNLPRFYIYNFYERFGLEHAEQTFFSVEGGIHSLVLFSHFILNICYAQKNDKTYAFESNVGKGSVGSGSSELTVSIIEKFEEIDV